MHTQSGHGLARFTASVTCTKRWTTRLRRWSVQQEAHSGVRVGFTVRIAPQRMFKMCGAGSQVLQQTLHTEPALHLKYWT